MCHAINRGVQLLITAAAVLVGTAAHAMDTKDFAAMCKQDLSDAGTYVIGVIDKWQTDKLVVQAVVEPAMRGNEAYRLVHNTIVGDFCMPESANVAMAIRYGCDWAISNPDKGDYPAANGLLLALKDKWPCPSNK